jgi:sugar diacid utilization regulator
VEEARRLKFKLERPHQLLLVHGPNDQQGNSRSLVEQVENWARHQPVPMLPVRREKNMVILVETESTSQGYQLAQTLARDLSQPQQPIIVGVGQAYRPNSGTFNGIQKSYEEAAEAMHLALLLGQPQGVMAFADLGLLHWLYHLPADRQDENMYLTHLKSLAAYDAARGTRLVQTLESYLDHGGTLINTAQALFIHRNTLLHRLERIQTLCPVDLHDPWQRLNLHAAAKCYRLQQNRGGE